MTSLSLDELLCSQPQLSDDDTPEAAGDRHLAAQEYEPAYLSYAQIQAPNRRIREKIALSRFSIGDPTWMQLLGDFDEAEASSVGCTLEYLAVREGEPSDYGLTATGRERVLSITSCPQLWACPFANPLGRIATDMLSRARDANDLVRQRGVELLDHVRQTFPDSDIAAHFDLLEALECGDLDRVASLVRSRSITRWPVTASLYHAAVALRDSSLAKSALKQLYELRPEFAKSPDLAAAAAAFAGMPEILDGLPGWPYEGNEELQFLVELGQARRNQDVTALTNLLANSVEGALAGFGNGHLNPFSDYPLHLFREDTIIVPTCPLECWPGDISELFALPSLLQILPAGELRGRVIARAYLEELRLREGGESCLEGLAQIWPSDLAKFLVAINPSGYPDWKAIGRLLMRVLDSAYLESDLGELLLREFCLLVPKPEKPAGIAGLLAGIEAGSTDLPDSRRSHVLKEVYDHLLDPAWGDMHDAKCGAQLAVILEALATAWPAAYGLKLAYCLYNVGDYEGAADRLKDVRALKAGEENYVYLHLLLARKREDIEHLECALADFEKTEVKARTERVREAAEAADSLLKNLLKGRMHRPKNESVQDPLPAKLPAKLQRALDALDDVVAGLNAAELLTLQVRLVGQVRRIDQVMPVESVGDLVATTWDAKLPRDSLTSTGREFIKKQVKYHGAATVVLAIPDAVNAHKNPEQALIELASQCNALGPKISPRTAYLLGILRNRFRGGYNAELATKQVREAMRRGMLIDDLIGKAKELGTWREWSEYVQSCAPF